MSIRHIAAP